MLEINNTTGQKINLAKTKKIVDAWLISNKKKGWIVSLGIVGAKKMQSLNNNYRGINKSTDVLSFSGSVDKLVDKYLGEVIINIEEVKKATKYLDVFGLKKSPDYIFNFLLIHGLLHLIGYNDREEVDRQEMLLLGEEFLAKFY